MATTPELIEYYADLLILQYVRKARARAHIKTLAEPIIMDQIPLEVQAAFDLDTAEGVQLDVLGKYIGASRENYTLTGNVSLNDDDFRTILKMVLIKNTAGSSLSTIQDLLAGNFPNQITVSDNALMGLNYVIAESLGTDDLLEVLVVGGYLPAPMGVQTSVAIVPSLDITYFGMRTYDDAGDNIAPFNQYSFVTLTWPWLTY